MLWLRETEVVVGGVTLRYPDLEIQFNIPFDDDPEPNMGEVRIYNLSASTRAEMKKGYPILINSGYQGERGMIFQGVVSKIRTRPEGVNRVTTLTIGDATDKWKDKRLNKSYKGPTQASFIIKSLAAEMGLRIGEINLPIDKQYNRGLRVSGYIGTKLRDIAVNDCKAKMHITNGFLYVRPPKGGKTTAFVLNPDTGLVGTPTEIIQEKDGKEIISYEVVSLLNHQLTVDSIIKVESKFLSGFYRIKKGTFISDGSQHITKMEVVWP